MLLPLEIDADRAWGNYRLDPEKQQHSTSLA
jgi:hypothetical protein